MLLVVHFHPEKFENGSAPTGLKWSSLKVHNSFMLLFPRNFKEGSDVASYGDELSLIKVLSQHTVSYLDLVTVRISRQNVGVTPATIRQRQKR